uniref:Uncharacterized protein n=1 Tax=Sinocyclocheilus grahami TaxID=75366 RepID=A0A672NAJ4_SINGR
MRSKGVLVFVLLGALTAYYVYSPIPNNIEERWKLMLADSFFRSLSQLVSFLVGWGENTKIRTSVYILK